MPKLTQRFTTRVAGLAAASAIGTGILFAVAPAASASHACQWGAYAEVCFFRAKDYNTAFSRAFSISDTTYANDYYTGTDVSINNTISSYVSYVKRYVDWFYECRYVSQETCTYVIDPGDYDSNLAGSGWNDSFSSHLAYDLRET